MSVRAPHHTPRHTPSIVHTLLRWTDGTLPPGLDEQARQKGRLLVVTLCGLLFLSILFLARGLGAGFGAETSVIAAQAVFFGALLLGIRFTGFFRLGTWLLVLELSTLAAVLTGMTHGAGFHGSFFLLALPTLGLLLGDHRLAAATALLVSVSLFTPASWSLAWLSPPAFETVLTFFVLALTVGLAGLGLIGWGYAAYLHNRLTRAHDLLRQSRADALERRTRMRNIRQRALDATAQVENEYQARHEAALAEMQQRREELEHLKATVLANISHEVRTPLTGILGYLAVLEDLLEDHERELARPIRTHAERLLETLNAILDRSRLEKGQAPVVLKPLTACQPISETVRALKPRAHAKGLHLEMIVRAPDACALLDPKSLDTILFHLISNAIKFTNEGRVTVEVDADETWVMVHVRDTGVGIAPHFLPHLFDPFRQASTGETRRFGGNGIGLTIVKKLTNRLRGEVSVESTPHQGATFTVRFPRIISSSTASPAFSRAA